MLPHLASRLFGTPLLVQRAKLDVILAVLSERLNLAAPDVELAPPLPRASTPPAFPSSSVAVVPIHGTLVKRTLGLEAASGLVSYADIGARLEAALGDPTVAGIVLDIDSPGGETGGCFELARRVREAAGLKPIWAVANDAAFSAAYAIGCAAERLYVTETGGVGSIGVIALHVDQSVKDAQDGYRYTAITAGERKNDYSPHEPLHDAARVALQAEVDRLHGLFVAHVAAMRGISEDAVRATEAALQRAGRAVIRIITPHFNIVPGGRPEEEAEPVFDRCKALHATFCFPHQCVTDALIDRMHGVIRDYDRYARMIRERGMIPGLSTHMPEAVVIADKTNADVATYIQIYNAAGFLMQVEADWVMRIIQNAKQPVLTIKPLAAGRLGPAAMVL